MASHITQHTRSHKVVNYSKFAAEDLDDDFHETTPPMPKSAKTTKERKDKRKKAVKGDSDDEWSFEKSPQVEKKKRLSVDEKRFERDLNTALAISQDTGDRTAHMEAKTASHNPVVVDGAGDIEFIETVDDAIPSKRASRGDNCGTTSRKPTKTKTISSSESEASNGEEESPDDATDEDFEPLDSDSDAKPKPKPATKNIAVIELNKNEKPRKSALCKANPSPRSASLNSSITNVTAQRTNESILEPPLLTDLTSPTVKLVKVASPVKGKSPKQTKSTKITTSDKSHKTLTSALPLTSHSPFTSHSHTITSPVTRKPRLTPKTIANSISHLTSSSPLTSPGLRLGLSRKQQVKSLHPTVTQITT